MKNLLTEFSKLILLTLLMPLFSTVGTHYLLLATSDLETLIGVALWVAFVIDVHFLFKVRKRILQSLARRDHHF